MGIVLNIAVDYAVPRFRTEGKVYKIIYLKGNSRNKFKIAVGWPYAVIDNACVQRRGPSNAPLPVAEVFFAPKYMQ